MSPKRHRMARKPARRVVDRVVSVVAGMIDWRLVRAGNGPILPSIAVVRQLDPA